MRKLKGLIQKSLYCLKNEGLIIFLKRVKRKLFKRKTIEKIEAATTSADVLFIIGCLLPHPTRYRVSNQREQLLAYGINSVEVYYDAVTEEMAKLYRVFIFFRCETSPVIEKLVNAAKSYNKIVLFDIDDLLFDLKYTNTIKYLDTMNEESRARYNSNVTKMGTLLKMCDGAITSTDKLAEELSKYVPKVFVNRNVASEIMVQKSEQAVYDRDVLPFQEPQSFKMKKEEDNYKLAYRNHMKRQGKINIGYFSGSITHNEDVEMILAPIVRLFKEFENLQLVIVGELDIPDALTDYKDRLIVYPFMDWQKLPWAIASVDINLVPLKDTLFNEAKSENKWLEAGLVKVVTIASNVGALAQMIEDGHTGILCNNNEDEWYEKLKDLIVDKEKRIKIAQEAYNYVRNNGTTINTGMGLRNFLKSIMTPNIAFILPSVKVSGGVLVALKHCVTLKKAGCDVFIICEDHVKKNPVLEGVEIPAFFRHEIMIHITISACVSTLWSTLNFSLCYPNIKSKLYLVQNFETDFYGYGNGNRLLANSTYNTDYEINRVNYVTISKWCQEWLLSKYNKKSDYIPNGLNLSKFTFVGRNFSKNKKVRILIEGNSDDHYKNVDESFRISNKLSSDRYEIWYMSYLGLPKEWYRHDKFLHQIPYDDVPKIYQDCDILLKSSTLESFSYPPIEMMATGGLVVALENGGNVEFLEHDKNCIFYKSVDDAVEKINMLVKDSALREKLIKNGLATAKSRSWDNIEKTIVETYTKYL